MKVAIITTTDGANYGNRLQNYALQFYLDRHGFDVTTIRRRSFSDKKNMKYYLRLIKKYLFPHLYRKYKLDDRKKRFDSFNDKYIKFSKVALRDNIAPRGLGDKYDYFVCGSDQIWNTRIKVVEQDLLNNLAFFAEGEKRIAYAASFGTEDVPNEYEDIFRRELSQFNKIGVREKSGNLLVKSLTGRNDIVTVLDPTMLLTCVEWSEVMTKPKYIQENERFILTYFLGGRNEKVKSYISQVEQAFSSRTINLDIEFLLDDDIENNDYYCTDPMEFVWLICNAEYVLTDSFHATVFSIIFHKEFVVLERKEVEKGNKMVTRIECLLNLCGLANRMCGLESLELVNGNWDYESVDRILEIEKQKSKDFLLSSLK